MKENTHDLVQKFIDGDHKAFAELVRRYREKVYAIAFNVLGNHLDADEVVQEAFVRVYRRKETLQGVGYFPSFLMKVATNYAIDLLRKRKGHSTVGEDTSSLPGEVQLDLARQVDTPSERYQRKQLMEQIYKALDQLPPRQRATAVLHDIEGFSKAEIARIFECPEATVRSNLHIARTKLRKILKQRLRSKE